jgi:nitroreductase
MLMKALSHAFVYPIGNGYHNMDTYQCVVSKLEVREFNTQEVEAEIKLKVLDAARLTGTGMNLQHWRFILVEDKTNLNLLAQDSTSGAWIAGADFAVIILTNPKYHFHLIDAGRAAQSMQLTAWSQGVGSGLFTGIREEKLRSDFRIPNDLTPSIVLGFGYPLKALTGKRKNRLPLNQLLYKEQYGSTAS